VNKANTKRYLRVQPASWMTDAHSFLGKIRSKMIIWKITNEKVILKTAEVPKQAFAAPS
jgi:hypothetical protein